VVIFEGVLILPFFSQTILVGSNFAKTEKSKLKKIRISALSQVILFHDGQFYWWRKPEFPEKTIDLLMKIKCTHDCS
jgi:hypothetical protein